MRPRVKRLTPEDYLNVEHQVAEIFRRTLFAPMVEVGNEKLRQNIDRIIENAPIDDLIKAMRSGRIHMQGGVFSGQFSASIASALRRMGGIFDARTRVYKMPAGNVPPLIQAEATMFAMRSKAVHEAMIHKLNETQTNLDTILQRSEVRFDPTINKAIADFRDVAHLIGVSPEITEESKRALATDYNRNMKLWINKFCREEIVELRSRVEANAIAGGRFERLTDMIRERYGVTVNKAKFLARQETALFTAKFHEQRFGEAGVQKYIWSTSHDERVRPEPGVTGKSRLNDHRSLDGREFFFSSPPIVDRATGRRANPGEDFNCRCVPIPILQKIDVAA